MSPPRIANYMRMAKRQGKVDRMDSPLEARFEVQAKAMKLPPWERNYRFLSDAGLELDWAWPGVRFGIEIQGEVHRIRENFHRDIEKAGLALMADWLILPIDGPGIRAGTAINRVQVLLARRTAFFDSPHAQTIPPLTMPQPAGHVRQPGRILVSDSADEEGV